MGAWLHHLTLRSVYGDFSLFGQSIGSVIVNVVVLLGIIYLLSIPFLFLVNYLRLFKQKLVCLELTPPGFMDLPFSSYEKLFTDIYGLGISTSFKDKLFRRKAYQVFEVVADKTSGTRFQALLPKDQVDNFKRIIKVNLPGTLIKVKDEPILDLNQASFLKIKEFKLKGPFYYSFKVEPGLGLAYQAALLDMKEQELLAFQIVARPLSSKLNQGTLKKLEKSDSKRPGWLLKLALMLFSLAKLVFRHKTVKTKDQDNSRAKLESPLFQTSLRLLVAGENKAQINKRSRAFKSSLTKLAYPGRQALVDKRSLFKKVLFLKFAYRLPDIYSKNSPILSVQELASLYHFPGLLVSGQENIRKSLSRTLPASLDVRSIKHPDVILGENFHDDTLTPIGLSSEERARHVYIIGGTGNGKTTMLEYMINQDTRSGKGLMVIDPHGDLSESVIRNVPKARIRDVIYFNPADIDYPIGLNLLEMPDNLTDSELLIEKDRVTESIISVFRKTFDSNDDGNAYRVERLLRNAILTALTIEDATLFNVSRILSDKYYRWSVIENLEDESLKRFWLEEFNKAGDYQRVKISLGPFTRLERFERNLHLKRILDQPESGFDLDKVINSGKIIICNLSKGAIGEDTSSLLGSMLMAKLQLAALRRQGMPQAKRRPFYLYVDEFQDYASSSFVSMFSEARKYGLYLTIAQQSPAQLGDKSTLNIIMDNIGSLVAFRSKSLDSEKLILSQLAPYVGKHEINNLPRYVFYAKLAATEPKQPVSGRTVLVKRSKVNVTNQIIKSSRTLYASETVLEPKALSLK